MKKIDTNNLEQLSFDNLLEVYDEWKTNSSMNYNWSVGVNDELYPELKDLLKMITIEPKCLIELEQIDNVIQGELDDTEYNITTLSRIIISLIRLDFKSVVFNYNFNGGKK